MKRRKLSTLSTSITASITVLIVLVMLVATAGLPGVIVARAADNGCQIENALVIGSFGFGVNCLDASGWKVIDQSTSSLQSDQVNAEATCADGSTWVANSLGLLKISADKQQAVDVKDDISSIEALACDGKGGIWAAHYKGVSHFVDGKWETTDSTKLGSGDGATLVKDVAVDTDGTIYVVTSNSVAVYNGDAWKVYEDGKGFDKQYFLEKIALDGKGKAYVAQGSGLLVFDGKTWKEQANDGLYSVTSVAVDSKGTVWVGTYSQGLASFDGTGWTTYDSAGSKLSYNHINDIAIDSQDRLWIGTEYGLDVFDGKAFTVYRMDNSGLTDNDIKALVVTGKGPDLPAAAAKAPGTMSGTLVSGSDPVADATVELCTVFVPSTFTGDTPCADQPGSQQTKTGADGKFKFDKLNVGHYGLVLQKPDGKWAILVDSFGLSSTSDVAEGKDSDVGIIDVTKKADS